MSKHHVIVTTRDGDLIYEYDTNCDLPHIGDYLQLHMISGEEFCDTYKVISIYNVPLSEEETNIHVGVEKSG